MGNSQHRHHHLETDKQTFPFIFHCAALGTGIKSVATTWQQLSFTAPHPNGRVWGLQLAEAEDAAVFIIDGTSRNAAFRLLQEKQFALEVSYRQMNEGDRIVLWHAPESDHWACRFCINDDATISPADYARPIGSGKVHDHVVLGIGGDDGRSIVLVKHCDYLHRFVLKQHHQGKIEHEIEMIWASALSIEADRCRHQKTVSAKVTEIMNNRQYLANFQRDGIMHIPGAVSSALVDAAKEYLDHRIAMAQAEGHDNAIEQLRGKMSGTFVALTNCYNNSLLPGLMQALLAAGHPIYQSSVQIALRFPGDMTCDSSHPQHQVDHFSHMCQHWHIDGCATDYTPGSSDHYGEIHNFDGLIGILLSDVEEEMSGELCAFPGSHYALADFFRNGTNLDDVITCGVSKLPTGAKTKEIFNRPVRHCIGRAGDAFILNFLTAHLIAPNMSSHIRKAIYFRITGPEFTMNPQDPSRGNRKPFQPSLVDPWINWKGL